ncbi:MAG: CoA transferase [Candidatus Bathyarchaeota archaeon]|nr:CoA transferase [Candidatus Bathyarchaeota archaeon]
MKMPLDDIRVLDMTHVWMGPWCTMMLAEMGAEVIRVEPPWGAIDRLSEGMTFGGASFTFHHLNLNKKALTLNLKHPDGKRLFKELLKKSDVLVQNMSPGSMEKLGLGYDELKKVNPKIIYAAMSGFGQYGPYTRRNSYAPIAEAMSGHTRLTGDGVDPNGPPIEMAMAYGDLGPGTLAAMAIIAALRYRDHTGVGQMIDVAQFDCMTALNPAVTGYNLSGMLLHEMRKKSRGGSNVGGMFKTKDGGYVVMGAWSPSAVENLKKLLGSDEPTKEMATQYIGEHNRDEIAKILIDADIAAAPIYQINETVADPHLKARDMWVTVEHPTAGKITVPNFPVKMSETPGKITSAAPLLSQNTREILTGLLGVKEEELNRLMEEQAIGDA